MKNGGDIGKKKKNGGKTRRKMNFQFEDQIGCTEDI